ncbi:Intermembrane lipid transfer protein VPS13-like C-terminal domain-containing protein [Entamoeba marina]
MEIPYTGLSFLTLFIDKYIPLYLNLKDEKRSYPLLLKNKEYGYVVVKPKTFQNSQIIKVTSPIHFENKTTIQLKIRHNKNELTLEPNCSKFFNQIILTQNLKCYLFSENYPRNGIELYISKQLVSATQNNLRKKEKSVFIGEHFKMSIIFNDSIPMCTKYLDPVVVRFEPVFEIVNNLPFKLYFECKLDMKNNNTLSPSRSPILKHMFSKCEFQKKIIFQPKTNFKTETDSEEKGCHLTNSQIFTVDPFSKGSISIASPIDSFVYYLTILEVQQKFDFKENEVKSNLITFSPNNKKLPFVKVGKHQFIQKLKGNQIIIESPYFLKNETQLLLSVYDYGFLSPTNKYQIYAPIFVQKNILDKNANVIKFGNTKINKEKNEQLELQLGVEKVFNIKENGIVHNIIAQVNPYSDEDINTLCILFKNHFIIENSIDEEIRISNGLKSVTLLPNKQTPIHFEKVMISLKNGESGVILLSRVDEYQIMLTQKKTKKIYNIKTVNIKGTFKTTISGCSVPFIRLNNYTFESFWIHISNYTFVVNCQPQSTIPLAWLNPSQERVFIIDHQKINPFNVEEEIVIRGYQVLIDTEDCTTTITIGTEKGKKEKLLATLSLRIPVVGVSLFKSKAIEELSITINEVRMFILYMDRHVGVEFQFDYLQIDSQELQKECCPVIVSPTPLDWIYNPNESYFHLGFIMVVTPKRSSLKLLYFSEFSFFLEPFILKKLYNTFKQYPTDIIPQLNDSNSTSTTEVRCIIRKVTINAWNINFSIGKECTEPPKHATFLNIVKHATELGLERIPITLSKQNYENKVLPFGLLSSEIFESFKTDVDSMKWVLVGKIFGFQTLARKSEDMDNKKQEKVFLCTSDLIPLTTKQYIVKSFGRTNDCLLEPNLNETRTQTKSKKFWKRTESPTIKTVPQTMVNAQKSTIHYSIMDGTKNFGKSLVKGVKGLWKTPVSLTEIAGEQNKKLAPVGFMSGVVIGAAGVFVKPIDGAIGFFKSLNDGLTGISFGQIAKERMRPPRLCRGSIVVYNYFESQGRSYLYEADDKEYYNSTFVTWIKQVKESEIYGIIFTSKCMIGINKKIGSSAVAEWKIPYIMIQEFGLDNDIIIVTVKPNEKNRKRIKDNQVLLYYWSSEWIQNISSIIKTIKRNIEKYD